MRNRVGILIDGGFFVKRFSKLHGNGPRIADMQPFISDILKKVQSTTLDGSIDVLFRAFYYDCRPYGEQQKQPDGTIVDFSKTGQSVASRNFQKDLKTFPQMALRLGDLSFDGWKIDGSTPPKYIPDFKQKSVDIKLGLDIAWMASKGTVDKLVLVAGDSDFVAPMKFARKEGILIYLESMQHNVKMELKEHADFII
jgi:uncharacterized LabA/DUF88 family protein